LKLRDECWYIGHTTNLNARIAEHLGFTGRYSKQKFLTLHPVENIHSVQIGSLDDENKLALEYIETYGREKVCGGKMVQRPSRVH
jgi:predicted GIY-YIG superfamily endonuclease